MSYFAFGVRVELHWQEAKSGLLYELGSKIHNEQQMTDIWKSLSLFGTVQIGYDEFMDVNFESLNVQPNT